MTRTNDAVVTPSFRPPDPEPDPDTIYRTMARRRGQRKGHLFERSGSWLLRYRVDGAELNPETGKPKREQVTKTIAPSKGPGAVGIRQARRIAWDGYLSVLDQAHRRPSSAKTFGEFVSLRYRPDVIAQMKRTSKSFTESLLRKHLIPILGPMALREITSAQIQGIANLKAKQVSSKTVKEINALIGRILKHARQHQWYFGELPTEAVRLPELIQKERQAPTWEQVCRLSRALSEPCATLVIFLTLTGLRIGEAMGLRWDRVNLTLEPRMVGATVLPPLAILVSESYVMGQYQTLKPSKAGKRIIPLPEWFAPRLSALVSPHIKDGTQAVFANSMGSGPTDQHNLAKRVLKPTAKALGMPWISWHCFRHAHASLTDQLGLSTAERQKILGHSTAAMTLHYSHPELEAVRAKLAGMVDPKMLQ